MRKILSILIVLAMVSMLTSGAHAAETVTQEYITGGVRVVGVGLGFVLCSGSSSCDLDGDGQRNVGPIGGASLEASTFYTNVIVSTSDDVYGTNGGFSVCFYNPDGDNWCDEDDYSTGTGCGTRALLDSPFAGDSVVTFIYTFVVTEDLEQCGSSTGVITADFF